MTQFKNTTYSDLAPKNVAPIVGTIPLFSKSPEKATQLLTQARHWRLAYVVGAFWNSVKEQAIELGQHPRPEFLYFAKAAEAHLFTFSDTKFEEGFPNIATHAPQELAKIVLDSDVPFDCIVASGEDVGLALAQYANKKGDKTPIFIVMHGMNLTKHEYVERLRAFGGSQVHFLCLSERIRRTLEEMCGIARKSVHNAGYGVDMEFFHAASRSTMPPLIVSAGTAVRDYGTLLTAVENLKVDIVIAADSEWHPAPVNLPSCLSSNVTVVSCGNYLNLRDLYSRASFVVVPLLPVLRASGYAVTIEAMAMGKAVVLTETQGGSDFVVHGTTGYYVPPMDPGEMRRVIDILLDNPDQAHKMGEAGRRRCQEKFFLEHYCERMWRIIFSTLDKRNEV